MLSRAQGVSLLLRSHLPVIFVRLNEPDGYGKFLLLFQYFKIS
uniref:Uncharacterized protein n=1 Tax=Ascaris lumbricoides TaxID=6252 RepID=A0A0M3IHR0_ASCLU